MSPLLWKKIATGLSAGRVQSAGLKLLVDRERERMPFHSAAYAGLRAMVFVGGKGGGEGGMEARLQAVNRQRVATGTDFDPKTGMLLESKKGSVLWLEEGGMEEVAARLAEPRTNWVVKEVDTKVVTRKRPAPFTTSTLQQDANSRLGFTASQTMKLAQELYEEGHISYMRTDSPNMGPEVHFCSGVRPSLPPSLPPSLLLSVFPIFQVLKSSSAYPSIHPSLPPSLPPSLRLSQSLSLKLGSFLDPPTLNPPQAKEEGGEGGREGRTWRARRLRRHMRLSDRLL